MGGRRMKYMVYIEGLSKGIECKSKDEVWHIINNLQWGMSYHVVSPTENTDEFIPLKGF
jgi:hypothetical protein